MTYDPDCINQTFQTFIGAITIASILSFYCFDLIRDMLSIPARHRRRGRKLPTITMPAPKKTANGIRGLELKIAEQKTKRATEMARLKRAIKFYNDKKNQGHDDRDLYRRIKLEFERIEANLA